METPKLDTTGDVEPRVIPVSINVSESMDKKLRELKSRYGARAVNEWLRELWKVGLSEVEAEG